MGPGQDPSYMPGGINNPVEGIPVLGATQPGAIDGFGGGGSNGDCCAGGGVAIPVAQTMTVDCGPGGNGCGPNGSNRGLQTIQRSFTAAEKLFLGEVKSITPKPFLEGTQPGFDTDVRLLGVAALALSDYNSMPPGENYNFNSMPPGLRTVISMGTQYYLATLKQMELSLIDISYSDNGLSINFNRVANLNTSIAALEKPWLRMLENRKKLLITCIGGVGLATPRFQSNLSRFIGMLGDGAYGWNLP